MLSTQCLPALPVVLGALIEQEVSQYSRNSSKTSPAVHYHVAQLCALTLSDAVRPMPRGITLVSTAPKFAVRRCDANAWERPSSTMLKGITLFSKSSAELTRAQRWSNSSSSDKLIVITYVWIPKDTDPICLVANHPLIKYFVRSALARQRILTKRIHRNARQTQPSH